MEHDTKGPGYALSARGPGITDEHRKTGAVLEEHWETLAPHALAKVRDLIEEWAREHGADHVPLDP